MKNLKPIIIIGMSLLGVILSFLTIKDDSKYETSRDKIYTSPNGTNTITLRYDYVSRPYIFKNGKLIFETNKAGFMETVNFNIEWIDEDDLILKIDIDKEKYKDDVYTVHIK